jgi:Asp/Glu/hydantoin racemase
VRLLLINPNTSPGITERLAVSARRALGEGDTLSAVTAEGSPAVVRSALQLQQANANAQALAHRHASRHDAILLAISLDGAAVQLRDQFPAMPVVGMTEAALLTACLRAERIGLLTLGASLLPLYKDRVAQIGISARVVAYAAPEAPAAFGADAVGIAPELLDLLTSTCEQMRGAGAQVIVLAGAVLCGYAEQLQARCAMPVLDGVQCAARQLRLLCDA